MIPNKEPQHFFFRPHFNIRKELSVKNISAKTLKYINKNSKSLILNCGYGKPYSVLDIANILKRKNNNTQINYKNRRPGDIAEVYSDTKEFDKILKLKPKYDQLECILDSAYKWEKVMKKFKTLKR